MAQGNSSIVDNRDGNTLLAKLTEMGAGGRELWIATAFFSLDALHLLADSLTGYERVRILFGDDASASQRRQLLERLRAVSDADLLALRADSPRLAGLAAVQRLFDEGRVEARCYTAQKFHAKAYLTHRPDVYPQDVALLGSGNFTRPGLMQNIELNAVLTPEQTAHLRAWYEARWAEAQADVVTDDLLAEIKRQIDLYEPYWLYLKALWLWGVDRQEEDPAADLPILPQLDEHQRQGFWQALTILGREHGVMVCDGVGLGKSYIALALMQHYCRQGKRVLLLAPKNILSNSWDGYLEAHLADYREPFGSIASRAMTALGFDPADLTAPADGLTERQRLNLRALRAYADRADLVVIDESHNFRTSAANRYRNLMGILEPRGGRRKDVVLLTATPINTSYVDAGNQLALITHEAGRLAGYPIERIRAAAREADSTLGAPAALQPALQFEEQGAEVLQRVFEQVLIQRSRTTCQTLSGAAGRTLHFPQRRDPEVIDVTLGPGSEAWQALIRLTDRRFQPGVAHLHELQRKISEGAPERELARLAARGAQGIKLSAFLTEQYRRVPQPGSKVYQDEIRLAGLVYANALKQLESSPAAFQGILQSLGAGLIGRLRVVFGEAAADLIAEHQGWVRTPLFGPTGASDDAEADGEDAGLDDAVVEGEGLDLSGDELDAWLQQAIRSRQLDRKLRGFTAAEFRVDRWREAIADDLGYLREIHAATLAARRQPDPKLEQVLPHLQALLAEGRRVLLFTQSQRTAEYLEQALRARLKPRAVARIDSRVEVTRPSIIHAFCPGYNPRPAPWSRGVPERIDLLVSTDVLSEGVNLQQAGAVVNYDVHWNPVRLIQRIGRVDRRLDPALTPQAHDFRIVNVLPPQEIETIINLVGTIEHRTRKISRALGLDQLFFRANDDAGTLKEFNRLYEGTLTVSDEVQTAFTAHFHAPGPDVLATLEQMPPGAFGVWAGAPCDGLFALFALRARESATAADRERFGALIGRPVLALQRAGERAPLLDAPAILKLLAGTVPDEASGTPSDELALADGLKKLRNAVRQSFAEIELPRTFYPELVCWMELKTDHPTEPRP